MLNPNQFGGQLQLLTPDEPRFLNQIDDLVNSINPNEIDSIYPYVFSFFAKYPEIEMGNPGTLVHAVEKFYPNYLAVLKTSLSSCPSITAVLMAHRILNSQLAENERQELLGLLSVIASSEKVPRSISLEASELLEFQRNKTT